MPVATPVTIAGAGPRVRGGPWPGGASGLLQLDAVAVSGGGSVPSGVSRPSYLAALVRGQWAAIDGTESPPETGDYAGTAWRDDGVTLEVFAALGGGHNGNNTINRAMAADLTANAPGWVQLRPSGNATGYSGQDLAPDAGYFLDGSPGPRHPYNGITWWQARGEYIIGGCYWGADGTGHWANTDGFVRATGAWQPAGTYPARIRDASGYIPEWREFSIENPITGELLSTYGKGTDAYAAGTKLDPVTKTFSTWSALTGITTTSGPNAWDERREGVYQFGPGYYFNWDGSTRANLVIDGATGTRTPISINASAAYTAWLADQGKYLSAAMVYDPSRHCFWWYNGRDGQVNTTQAANRLWRITPNDGTAWDMAALDLGGVTVPSSRGGADPINAPTSYIGTLSNLHYARRWDVMYLARPRGGKIHAVWMPFSAALQITSGSQAGTLPYTATVMPLRGEVPSGYTITSPEDSTLRATVIGSHDDGSAALVVVAGEVSLSANSSRVIHLFAAPAGADIALTAARIGALVSVVAVNFGGSYGAATLTDFSAPERVWWANSRVIHARYRLAAPTPGGTSLEAVIDITAFPAGHDRALVEVVVENGKLDAATATFASKPADATYTGATVTIAGTVVATVNSADAPTGTHQAFRAWYAKRWVGGDPQVVATMRPAELQRHPLLWRCDRPNAADLSGYAADAYVPWSTGRHPASNMGGTGDAASIGPLPEWEARALQTGDRRCWTAVEASALAVLSFNVNHRDGVTGLVPDAARMPTKYTKNDGAEGTWPLTKDPAGTRAEWELGHQPAAGLMAFIGRPSAVFMEIAQKVAVMTATLNNDPSRLTLFDAAAYGLTDLTGITMTAWGRGFAWGMRQTAHATFLSPDGSSWRAGGRVWLGRIARMGRACSQYSKATLNHVLGPYPSVLGDHDNGGDGTVMPGYQTAEWMNNFIVGEAHKVASAGLITDATEAAYMSQFADWVALAPVRFVNEQPDGGWRYVPYSASYMRADQSTFASYLERRQYDLAGWAPPAVAGQFYAYPTNKMSAAEVDALTFEAVASDYYTVQFWAALVAAVERNVNGSRTAWETVKQSLSNWRAWRAGFSTRPRWAAWPRNI